MAKKNRKKEQLPEGMSRRQAKMAARAAEREALQKDPRPYAGLAAEADLVALQEFVPSAVANVDVKGTPVSIVTVLPGAVAAMVREEDDARLVALQTQSRSQNPGRDLAFALNWVLSAKAGETLSSGVADGTQPKITELIDENAALEITEHDDFNWWFANSSGLPLEVMQTLQRANDSIIPSRQAAKDLPGSIWWVNPGGGKAHIRWIRTEENETNMLNALARIGARGELNLGDGTKFAGAFRTHGIVVPVFDLDPEVAFDAYDDALNSLNEAIEKEYANEDQLTAEERRQLENIKSRQVTI